LRRTAGLEAAGAILTPGNAQADPYRACLAIARGAGREGARLFEHSEEGSMEAPRDDVPLRLRRGTIHAGWAIIATGYATPEFEPLLARFRLMNTYVIATPRLDADARARVGIGDVMLWDSGRPYHYLRWTPDGRLLFGGRHAPYVAGARRPARVSRGGRHPPRDLVKLYPA